MCICGVSGKWVGGVLETCVWLECEVHVCVGGV